MKISIYDTDQQSAEHVLADNSYAGLALSPQTETQIRRFLRGEYAAPEDRGNAMMTLEFTVSREHDSISIASQYSLELSAAVPRQGLVKFERLDGGIVVFKRFFQGGVVKLVGIVPRGVRTETTWRIMGGKLLTEDEL